METSSPERPRSRPADLCPSCGRDPAARGEGPLRCGACGDALYRACGTLLPHRGTAPMLPMHVAAARLRNHLRRLAVTRPGMIEGNCYLLPFYRVETEPGDASRSFTHLATRLGEPRLERPNLPPGNLRPWEAPDPAAPGSPDGAGAGVRILPPTIPWKIAAERAGGEEPVSGRATELIHYPFWLMRVRDAGRIEGAWMDGIESRLIFHRIRLARPVPSRARRALWTVAPAAAAALGAILAPSAPLAAALAAWAAGAPVLHGALTRRWDG